jgi:hypothetical protein
MCRSRVEGGQRCSDHSTKALAKAEQVVRAVADGGSPEEIADAREQWDKAAVAHTSTDKGRREFESEAAKAQEHGDFQKEAMIRDVLNRGEGLRESNAAVLAAYRTSALAEHKKNPPPVDPQVAADIAAAFDSRDQKAANRLAVSSVKNWSPADRLAVAARLDELPIILNAKTILYGRIKNHVEHFEHAEKKTVLPLLQRFRNEAETGMLVSQQVAMSASYYRTSRSGRAAAPVDVHASHAARRALNEKREADLHAALNPVHNEPITELEHLKSRRTAAANLHINRMHRLQEALHSGNPEKVAKAEAAATESHSALEAARGAFFAAKEEAKAKASV